MPPESTDAAVSPPLVVLEASRALGPWTRFADQVYASASPDMIFRFTGGTADLDGVDVVHSTDTLDRLMRIAKGATPAERLAKTKGFVSQIDKRGIALVRPVFGPLRRPPQQHAESVRLLDQATTMFVAVEDASESPDPAKTVKIPFADISDRFVGYPVKQRIEGRVLALSPGKSSAEAAALMKTSFLARTPGISVRFASATSEPQPAAGAGSLREGPGVTSRVELLSDAAMIEEITASELVVVPKVATLSDMHLLMMVLSFGRPAIVPATPHVMSLAASIGDGWLVTYRGALTAEVLDSALTTVRQANRSPSPDLVGRGFGATGERYAHVFRTAAKRVKSAPDISEV